MNRSKLWLALMGGTAMLAFGQLASATTVQTHAEYTAAIDRASADYKNARAKCEPLAGHDKDMCVVEAQAGEKRAKALAESNYKGTTASLTDNRIANADADLMVAKVACEPKAAQEKEVCVKEAQATQVKLVADAKAHKTAVDAQTDARADTRDAQYKVALAKCDAMSGTERDSCVTSANSSFGK
jgi:hypothetical protein